ncbi:MAG: hypothetical protein ABJO86_09345 [Lentilitoribacter sp.]
MSKINNHLMGLFFGIVLMVPTVSFADIKCECRYFGNYVPVGSKICMNTPEGARMAKCEMMLNNPTWQFEEDECPLAYNMSPASTSMTKLASLLK